MRFKSNLPNLAAFVKLKRFVSRQQWTKSSLLDCECMYLFRSVHSCNWVWTRKVHSHSLRKKKVHEHSHAKIMQFICICTCTRYGCSMCFIDLWFGLSLDEHVWHLHTIAHLQIDYTQSLDCECTNVYRSAHSCHWFRNKKVRSHWLWNKKVRSHA